MSTAGGSSSQGSAQLPAAQSYRGPQAARPAATGASTAETSRPIPCSSPSQPPYRSSSVTTGARSSAASRAASDVLPAPDRPSTATTRVRPAVVAGLSVAGMAEVTVVGHRQVVLLEAGRPDVVGADQHGADASDERERGHGDAQPRRPRQERERHAD